MFFLDVMWVQDDVLYITMHIYIYIYSCYNCTTIIKLSLVKFAVCKCALEVNLT